MLNSHIFIYVNTYLLLIYLCLFSLYMCQNIVVSILVIYFSCHLYFTCPVSHQEQLTLGHLYPIVSLCVTSARRFIRQPAFPINQQYLSTCSLLCTSFKITNILARHFDTVAPTTCTNNAAKKFYLYRANYIKF